MREICSLFFRVCQVKCVSFFDFYIGGHFRPPISIVMDDYYRYCLKGYSMGKSIPRTARVVSDKL